MRGNPGKIVRWPDDVRTFIVYNKQPFLKEKKMVILTIVDPETYQPLLRKNEKKPQTLIQTLDVYNSRVKDAKVIGLVD